ncbi:MAG: enoyl-CoA hydratase/isomerase family protein [Rhodocyclales bacterium]|nr:enoyl-CoA hydratase/isomerase family protein [Rhodocyclales bacterium]
MNDRLNAAEVLFSRLDGVGIVSLNQPQVLNALDLPTIRQIAAQLDDWADDPSLRAVLFRSAGGRAFCAGGDIRSLYRHALAGAPELGQFFDEEYALDCRIHRYPKPTIALMDGVVMGGGMGIGQGCSLRIVTERTRMAMPETAIGLFPDVGASFFLSRLPPALANYLGLVGLAISGADALACGLADRLVPSDVLDELPTLIGRIDDDAWPAEIPRGTMPDVFAPDVRAAIDRHFSVAGIDGIMASLAGDGEPGSRDWSARTLAQMEKHSPLMLCVTHAQLQRGRGLALEACFGMERGLMRHCFAHGDAREGIRALLVDKDRAPRWQHANVADVDPALVNFFFS